MNQEPFTPHCPACGGQKFSPETELRLEEGNMIAAFKGVPGFLSEGPDIKITRVRICGRCGYIMLFLDQRNLKKLQESWERLQSRH